MRRAAIAIAAGLLLAGCGKHEGVRLAEAEIPAFQDRLDGGRFGDIYDAAAPELKSQVSRDQFITFLGAVHRKLGSIKRLIPVGWNETVSTSGDFVLLRYDCNFDEGKAIEQFGFRISDGKAVLTGYTINSMALLAQ